MQLKEERSKIYGTIKQCNQRNDRITDLFGRLVGIGKNWSAYIYV